MGWAVGVREAGLGSGRCACWPGCLRFKIFLPAAVPSQAAEQGGGALAPREERTVALSSSFAFSASRETFCQPWTPGIRGPRGEKGLGRCEKCSRGHGARQEEAVWLLAPGLPILISTEPRPSPPPLTARGPERICQQRSATLQSRCSNLFFYSPEGCEPSHSGIHSERGWGWGH